jgi:hypothetical protein
MAARPDETERARRRDWRRHPDRRGTPALSRSMSSHDQPTWQVLRVRKSPQTTIGARVQRLAEYLAW